MQTFHLNRGDAPLLISLPHNGSAIPDAIRQRMTAIGQRSVDTDWHVEQLYSFAQTLGASVLVPQFSRYVIDLNRPADGAALYPGQRETGLVPTISFSDQLIYREGTEPDAAEINERVQHYWMPYHQALRSELDRLRAAHGRVVLWEGHSIRSRVPMLFDGRLPDLNLGTAAGTSCAPAVQERVVAAMQSQSRYSVAMNGRFKGGYITRHYGGPENGVHALQMEIAQCNYMDEDRFDYLPEQAATLQPVLAAMLRAAMR